MLVLVPHLNTYPVQVSKFDHVDLNVTELVSFRCWRSLSFKQAAVSYNYEICEFCRVRNRYVHFHLNTYTLYENIGCNFRSSHYYKAILSLYDKWDIVKFIQLIQKIAYLSIILCRVAADISIEPFDEAAPQLSFYLSSFTFT